MGDFMAEYLSHLLPRLIGFSDSLDRTELFVGQPWVHIDDNRNIHRYTFKRDGRLIILFNGEVRVGFWEYIAETRGLLINQETDRFLLNQIFIDKGVLILAKDSFFEEPFILVNRKIVADLDIERYLKELLISKSGRNCLPLEEGIELEFDSDFLEIGSQVYLNDLPAMTGTYTSMDGVITVAIEEGRVTGMKYQKKYSTREGQITVSQRYVSRAAIGDMVMKLSRPAPDGVYNPIFSEQPEIHVKDGRILKVAYGGKVSDWIWLVILLVLMILLGVFGKMFGVFGERNFY